MLRDNFHQGFPAEAWEAGKAEAREIMIACAKRKGVIAYSDLVARIRSISLGAHDIRLFHFLGEISAEEDAEGRGMLTVVVVHKHGDMAPGPGFFELAFQLGRATHDETKCWVEELNFVYDVWAKR